MSYSSQTSSESYLLRELYAIFTIASYTKAFQAWRYVSDRTGIICFYNLPWLWMFAGRNNVFIWLTGWSFQTFNIFHRHIARLTTVQAIVHSIGYSVIEANYDELASSWRENYFYMGGIATVAMSLLLIVSTMVFRQRSYEVFLLLHIGFFVLTLIGLFYHVAIFEGEYNPYLWPLVAIWGFDRAARLVRWIYCNSKARSLSVTSTAIVTYDPDADLIRLVVNPNSDILKPSAGQHYFLYHFRQLRGWENHPFTLATYGASRAQSVVSEGNITKGTDVLGKELSSSETSSQLGSSHMMTTNSFTFLIRPYSGWTRRLKSQCRSSESGSTSVNVCIEGPYGHRSPLHTFENVLFVVGGTGISGALPYLQEHIEALGPSDSKTATRNIRLIWATKQAQMLRSIADLELKDFMGRQDIEIQIHCTSSKSLVRHNDTTKKSTPPDTADLEKYFISGRPDIKQIVLDFTGSSQNFGRTAVLACGPAGLSDHARSAVQTALQQGQGPVEYFEESFG